MRRVHLDDALPSTAGGTSFQAFMSARDTSSFIGGVVIVSALRSCGS